VSAPPDPHPPSAPPAGTTFLQTEAQQLRLRVAAGPQSFSVTLPIGFLRPGAAFRHDPPDAADLERAIEAVEDVVMPLARRIPVGTQLVTADVLAHSMRALASGAAGASALLPIEAIERLFNDLAALAQGRPPSQSRLPPGLEFAGYLLIVRELMHHLDFDTLTLTDPAA
jgi:hypothetical protein